LSDASHDSFTVRLTRRQAEALRALARLDELPPEIYAAEVLTRHIYHAYTPQVAQRAAESQQADGAGDRPARG
jgi:hypothetical protein